MAKGSERLSAEKRAWIRIRIRCPPAEKNEKTRVRVTCLCLCLVPRSCLCSMFMSMMPMCVDVFYLCSRNTAVVSHHTRVCVLARVTNHDLLVYFTVNKILRFNSVSVFCFLTYFLYICVF
jgi:hypothetical protein